MPLPTQPHRAIVPIIGERENGSVDFLGTGFFISTDGTFLTAKHVFENYGLDRWRDFQIGMRGGPGGPTKHPLERVEVSKRFDIALARAIDVENALPLELADSDAASNLDVLTEEYSGTTPMPPEEGPGLNVVPYTRKGNVICQRSQHLPGWPEAALTLELSYPALKGSSGAPVLVEQTGAVIGMILDNVEHHLLPAHVERIVDNKGKLTEEHAYFLPTGLAIHWSHLKEFVESVSKQADCRP